MEEARASWNTVYRSKEGFECQITLRDEEEDELIQRAKRIIGGITKTGGIPLMRRKGYPSQGNDTNTNTNSTRRAKTYIDENGVRRCNMKLKDGSICRTPVQEREGKYGKFFYCPNYRMHAK